MAQFKRNDIYALLSATMQQLTGESSYTVIDAQGFADAGKLAMEYSTDEIFNALSIVCGKMLMAVRPYKAKFWILDSISDGEFSALVREISFYSDKPLPSGAYNTQLYTNLADGFDNGTNPSGGTDQSTGSMWEQHPKYPFEMNWLNSETWQDCLTRYEHQLRIIFLSEDEFARFWEGMITEKASDIELEKESYNRLTMLSRMGLASAMAESTSAIKGRLTAIDMTAAFNSEMGTNYSRDQLLTTYIKEFSQFFSKTFKDYSDLMEDKSIFFQYAPTKSVGGKTLYITRHTPKSEQRFMLFKPFWERVKTYVLADIFNPEYLDLEKQFESVTYWQALTYDIEDRASVNMYLTVPGWLESAITSGVTTTDTKYTFNKYVLGALFDRTAVATQFQYEDAKTTPVEARKHYYNTWYTFTKGNISNVTKPFILFYMSENKPAENNEAKTTRKTASK